MIRWTSIAAVVGLAAAVGWMVTPRTESGEAPAPVPGVLRVLSVGVDRYRDVPGLGYPARDAGAVAEAFRSRREGSFLRVETRLLTDAQADRRGLLNALEWLRRSSRPGDVSVIYYAGHGGNDPPVGFYLAPGLYQDRTWRRTMITGSDLRRLVEAIPGRVVVLLDTCYAGALIDDAPDAGSGRVAYLVATRAGESNRGVRPPRRCDFTQALLEALDGRAGSDLDGDGRVTLDELGRHLARRVPDLRLGRQHPVIDVPRALRGLVLRGR